MVLFYIIKRFNNVQSLKYAIDNNHRVRRPCWEGIGSSSPYTRMYHVHNCLSMCIILIVTVLLIISPIFMSVLQNGDVMIESPIVQSTVRNSVLTLLVRNTHRAPVPNIVGHVSWI